MTASLPTGLHIKQLRSARGWSQDDLASRVVDDSGAPTTKATISKIERSTKPLRDDWLRRFAKAFGISLSELLGEQDSRLQLRQVPLVGKIAAGDWREAIRDPIGYVPAVGTGPNAFALEPEGDSMNMAIPEGAVVIVDPDDSALRDGKIYAIENAEGETTVKTYRAEPARLEPRSTNPVHQPIQLGREQFKVVGRVTMIMMQA